jgi:hypothetical protein
MKQVAARILFGFQGKKSEVVRRLSGNIGKAKNRGLTSEQGLLN